MDYSLSVLLDHCRDIQLSGVRPVNRVRYNDVGEEESMYCLYMPRLILARIRRDPGERKKGNSVER
jgi:hypothetical protein